MSVPWELRRSLQRTMERVQGDATFLEGLVREIRPGYDLNSATGRRMDVPFTKAEAARWIAEDLTAEEFFRLLRVLIDVADSGRNGRTYRVEGLSSLRGLVRSKMGLVYHSGRGEWVTASALSEPQARGIRSSARVATESNCSFVRMDTVGSVGLLSTHPESVVREAIMNLRHIAEREASRRGGAIDRWDGDGGLIWYGGDPGESAARAVLSTIAIAHDVLLYNLLDCTIEGGIHVRLAADCGPCSVVRGHRTGAVVDRLAEIESNHTEPDTVTITPLLHANLSAKAQRFFRPFDRGDGRLHRYALRWEADEEDAAPCGPSARLSSWSASRRRDAPSWAAIRTHEERTFLHLLYRLDDVDRFAPSAPLDAITCAVAGFHAFMRRTAEKHNGRVWIERVSDGLILFPCGEGETDSALCGLAMVLDKCFHDIEESPFADPVSFRLALHVGSTEYREYDKGGVNSAALGSTFHLCEQTPPGDFRVTEDALRFMPDRLRRRFVPAGTVDDRPVFRMQRLVRE